MLATLFTALSGSQHKAPGFAGGYLLILSFSTTSCSNDQPTTWDDVKKLTIKTSIDGVNFDIPLNYIYGTYARNVYNWPALSKEVKEGKTRSNVDFVKIYALLPDLEPVTEENLTAFMELGWGRVLKAFITHQRSFEYYFKYMAPNRLDRLPDAPDVPGMLHYIDNITKEEIFLSHDHAVSGMTFIRCFPISKIVSSPSCNVETSYRYEDNKETDGHSTPFYLKYSFAMSYLSQWREIDRKVKALYDRFAQSNFKHKFTIRENHNGF